MTYPTKEHPELFRERLLAADTHTPALRAEYERRLQVMLERPMTVTYKFAAIAAGVLGLGFACVFGYMAVRPPADLPVLARVGLGTGAVFGLGWAALSYRIVRRGTIRPRTDTNVQAALVWVFVCIMMTLFLLLAPTPPELMGIKMVLAGLVFFVFGGIALLQANINQAEMRTQERLVELQYKIAQLSEKLGGDDEGDDLLGTGVPR